MGRWPEWPGWLLAVSYLICALLLAVLIEIVHRRIVKPAADQFDRALSAARNFFVRLFARPQDTAVVLEPPHPRQVQVTDTLRVADRVATRVQIAFTPPA